MTPGAIRFSNLASDAFEQAFQSTNVAEALRAMAVCLDGMVIERYTAIDFSKSDGNPTEYDWVQHLEWDGKIWLRSKSNSPSLDENCPLYHLLLELLTVGQTIAVTIGDQAVVATHVPKKDYGDGITPEHIQLRIAKLL